MPTPSASPCSQFKTPLPARTLLSSAVCSSRNAAEAAMANPHLLFSSASVPALSHRADHMECKVSLLRRCSKSSTFHLCGAQCSPWLQTPICWGWGCWDSLLEAVPQPGLSKDLDKLSPTEITVPKARKNVY